MNHSVYCSCGGIRVRLGDEAKLSEFQALMAQLFNQFDPLQSMAFGIQRGIRGTRWRCSTVSIPAGLPTAWSVGT